jgi:hypothetical protein
MAVNLEKIRQDRAARQFAGELWDAPEGDTNIYVACGPRPDDDAPYWHCKMHYGLGSKGFSQAMCLEPSENPVLNDPAFIEQVEALKKNLGGGCAVCEEIAAGRPVSSKEDQDGKPSSRWLFLIMPISFRSDSRAAWQAQPPAVKGFLCGYNVWDKLCDQFGSLGDITDTNAATLIKVNRQGKKLQTKWDIQPDVETVRKPMKLSAEQVKMLADMVKPGGTCDPLRILASMARERTAVEALLKGLKTDDGAYEEVKEGEAETAEEPAKDSGTFKPPTGKKADAKKAEPKSEPKKAPKDDGELKQLTAKHGAPPNCFKIDPDPGEAMCQACPFKMPCANHCGVPIPPDPGSDGDASAEDSDNASTPGIPVEQAEPEKMYTLGETDDQYVYKGPAKGKHLFTGPDGKPVKVEPGVTVYPVEMSPDDDPGLKALEQQLAAKKAKGAKK